MSSSSDFLPPVRALVLRRAGGCCEVCAVATDHLELHHRRYRSRGGAGSVSNALALCGWGNHTGCHGWAHTAPLASVWGVSLASWQDPAVVPVWREALGTWTIQSEEGLLLPA